MSAKKSRTLSRTGFNDLLRQFKTMRRDETRTLNSDLTLQYGDGTDDMIVVPVGSKLTAMPSASARTDGLRVMMRFETDTQWVDVLDNARIDTRRKRQKGEPPQQVRLRTRAQRRVTCQSPFK